MMKLVVEPRFEPKGKTVKASLKEEEAPKPSVRRQVLGKKHSGRRRALGDELSVSRQVSGSPFGRGHSVG